MSSACSSSALDFFSELPYQDEIINGRFHKIQPESGITKDTKHIDFTVTGDDEVIDLNNSFIQSKIRLVTGAGAAIAAGIEACPINYIGATLWQQVKLIMGNDWVATISDQPYRAVLETLSSNGDAPISTWLQCAAYYKDTAGKHDTIGDQNEGFKSRKNLSAESKEITLYSRIHCDVFNQEKYLIPGVPLTISFTRHTDDLCILSTNDADLKIELLDVNLFVNKLELIGSKLNETKSLLQTNDAKYNYPAVQLFTKIEAPGPLSTTIFPKFGTDDLPSKILIAMVSNAAFNGRKDKNPFNFQSYNLKSVNVTVDGKSIHSTTQDFNPAKKEWDAAYWGLQYAAGFRYKNDGLSISRDEYGDGNFIMIYDLSPTQCDGSYKDPIKSGKLAIDLKFSKALPHTINIIVLAEYERLLTINRFGKVVINS